MGNSNSKGKKADAFQSYPSFSRTETEGSTRSFRSMRSRMSVVSTGSDVGSFKSALENPVNTPPSGEYITNGNGNSQGDTEGSYFPQMNNAQLPKSMQQLENLKNRF